MSRFSNIISLTILLQALTAFAGNPEDLVFKNSFERCDNFIVPPGAIEWDGGGDGESWSDAANWKGNVIPADSDSVAIADDGGITVIYDASLGTTVIDVMDICESLRITGGALEVAGSGFVRTDLELISGGLIANRNVTISGNFLHSNSGLLDGTGTVTVSGKYTWEQGTQGGTGETIANGGIDITTNPHTLRERTLTINGASTWTGGNVSLQFGATIDNNSTFDIQTDADMPWGANPVSLFRNDGTLTKSIGSDITNFGGDVINNSTLSVAAGSIGFQRAFTQGSTGTLHVDIADGSFDAYAITGAATLAGTLEINRVGGYEPGIGLTFQIMTYNSKTGTFSQVNGTDIGNGDSFSVNYNANDVTLEVID